jgi:hypothetical protein
VPVAAFVADHVDGGEADVRGAEVDVHGEVGKLAVTCPHGGFADELR